MYGAEYVLSLQVLKMSELQQYPDWRHGQADRQTDTEQSGSYVYMQLIAGQYRRSKQCFDNKFTLLYTLKLVLSVNDVYSLFRKEKSKMIKESI